MATSLPPTPPSAQASQANPPVPASGARPGQPAAATAASAAAGAVPGAVPGAAGAVPPTQPLPWVYRPKEAEPHPAGELMKLALKEYNEVKKLTGDQEFKLSDLQDITVESLDPEHPDNPATGDIKVAKNPFTNEALLLLEYSLKLKRKDGTEEIIKIRQTWNTGCEIPAPKTLKEKAFNQEIQVFFAIVKGKIQSPLCKLTKASNQPIYLEQKMKKLCKLSSFDWTKHVTYAPSTEPVFGRILSPEVSILGHRKFGSKLIGRQDPMAITAVKINKEQFSIGYQGWANIFSKPVTCKRLEEQETDIEEIEKPTAKLGSYTNQKKREIFAIELERAWELMREIHATELKTDEQGGVHAEKSLDDEIERGTKAAKTINDTELTEKVRKLEEQKKAKEEEITEICKKIKQKKPDIELPDFEQGSNYSFLKAHDQLNTWFEGAPLAHKTWKSKEPNVELKKLEEDEVQARRELYEIDRQLGLPSYELSRANITSGLARERCIKAASRLEKCYKELKSCMDVIEKLSTDGALDETKAATKKDKETLKKLGKRYGEIEEAKKTVDYDNLGRKVTGFVKKVQDVFPPIIAKVSTDFLPPRPPTAAPRPPVLPPPPTTSAPHPPPDANAPAAAPVGPAAQAASHGATQPAAAPIASTSTAAAPTTLPQANVAAAGPAAAPKTPPSPASTSPISPPPQQTPDKPTTGSSEKDAASASDANPSTGVD